MSREIIKFLIVFILLTSGIAKILYPIHIIDILKALPYFPDFLILITATLLPIFEISIAVSMLLNFKMRITLLLNNFLFLFFFLFSIYGTVIGLEKECGCFGNFIKSYFDWKMILRNFIFLALSTYLTYFNYKPSKLILKSDTI